MFFKKVTPKWGLVLMGGGSRGLAHIGVLDVLQKNGLIPDIIVGTSMGGLIGGLYASGMPLGQLKEITNNFQENKVISRLKSAQVAQKQKRLFDYLILDSYKNRLLDKFGYHKEDHFEGYLRDLIGDVLIENLPIKFACNALDLVWGKEVVFENGKLYKAIRATMSYPLLFDPSSYGNMLLIDGGTVNNAPVDIAKNLGADITILIDIHRPIREMPKTECTSMVHLVQRMMEAMMSKTTEEKLKMADLVLRVNPDFEIFDFSAPKEVISKGERLQRKNYSKLKSCFLLKETFMKKFSLG